MGNIKDKYKNKNSLVSKTERVRNKACFNAKTGYSKNLSTSLQFLDSYNANETFKMQHYFTRYNEIVLRQLN